MARFRAVQLGRVIDMDRRRYWGALQCVLTGRIACPFSPAGRISPVTISDEDLGRVTLLSPSQHFNYKFRSQSQRGASQKHKETITVDSNPVMHVARGNRQSIISGRERSQLTSADSAKASRMCQSGRNDCGDPGRHWVHGNNIHIDADSLIRHNRELLRLAAHARARSPLHLQNIIAWWQHNAIPSIFIRSNARDFFFAVVAQDDQRILGIISITELWRVSFAELNIFER
jgi:hypothetical protein